MVEVEEEIKNKSDIVDEKRLILYNDDVNSFTFVIACLIKYCHHNYIQAEQCALIVHHNGKCDIKNGIYSYLKPIQEALAEKGLTVKIE